MEKPNGIDLIFGSVEVALENCNRNSPNGKTFDPGKAKGVFARDILSLTVYGAGSDGSITPAELYKINKVMDLYGFGLNAGVCSELQNIVATVPFEVPTTLKVLVLSAMYTIDQWKELNPGMVKLITMNQMTQLSMLLTAYTNIALFAAVESELLDREKAGIIKCMKVCYDHIVDAFGSEFTTYCKFSNIEKQVNQW